MQPLYEWVAVLDKHVCLLPYTLLTHGHVFKCFSAVLGLLLKITRLSVLGLRLVSLAQMPSAGSVFLEPGKATCVAGG